LWGEHVGVAPGAELLVGLVAHGWTTTFAQMAKAIEWAVAKGAAVISMSVGKPGYVAELEEIVEFAWRQQTLIVAAIGNDGVGTHRSPGDYGRILGVGATDQADRVWTRSAGGSVTSGQTSYLKPDVYAPGVGVYSCIPGGRYGRGDGTSLAAPIVSGVAALVKQLAPTFDAATLRDHLLRFSTPIGVPATLGSTGRLISATAAVGAIP
jgi:subtilisin family serine protease